MADWKNNRIQGHTVSPYWFKTFFSARTVTCSCTDENNYISKGLGFYQFKYYCVVLVNHYPLRQKGSAVGYFGVDSTVFYALNVDSTDSFF